MPFEQAVYIDASEALGLRIIGAAVRGRRIAQGLSQAQLAFWAGLNQSTISRLERGVLRTMRMLTLARILGTLRMPPDLVFPGEPAPPSRRLPAPATSSVEED